jgi:hypothetical protein
LTAAIEVLVAAQVGSYDYRVTDSDVAVVAANGQYDLTRSADRVQMRLTCGKNPCFLIDSVLIGADQWINFGPGVFGAQMEGCYYAVPPLVDDELLHAEFRSYHLDGIAVLRQVRITGLESGSQDVLVGNIPVAALAETMGLNASSDLLARLKSNPARIPIRVTVVGGRVTHWDIAGPDVESALTGASGFVETELDDVYVGDFSFVFIPTVGTPIAAPAPDLVATDVDDGCAAAASGA